MKAQDLVHVKGPFWFLMRPGFVVGIHNVFPADVDIPGQRAVNCAPIFTDEERARQFAEAHGDTAAPYILDGWSSFGPLLEELKTDGVTHVSFVGDPAWHRHLDQASPMTAGLYIQATTNLRALPLTPWQGLGVLAAWAAGALLAGGLLLRFRDA